MRIPIRASNVQGFYGADLVRTPDGVMVEVNGHSTGAPILMMTPTGELARQAQVQANLADALDGNSRPLGLDGAGRIVYRTGAGLTKATPELSLDSAFTQQPRYVGRRALVTAAQGGLDTPVLSSAQFKSDESMVDGQLQRFQPDGQLDPSFGSGGTINTPFVARCAVQRADGGLITAAASSVFGFEASGSPDPRFGQGGELTLPAVASTAAPVSHGNAEGTCAALPDGAVVVVQRANVRGRLVDHLTRIAADGSSIIGPVRAAKGVQRLHVMPDSSLVTEQTIDTTGGGGGWTTFLQAFDSQLRPRGAFRGASQATVANQHYEIHGRGGIVLTNSQWLGIANFKIDRYVELVRINLAAPRVAAPSPPAGSPTLSLTASRKRPDTVRASYRCGGCPVAKLSVDMRAKTGANKRVAPQLIISGRPIELRLPYRAKPVKWTVTAVARDAFGRSVRSTIRTK